MSSILEESAVKISLGCKSWTRGAQLGFRIYADDIRSLVPLLVYPSSDGRWLTLSAFYEEVLAGRKVAAYSRLVVIYDGKRSHQATATIAWHGRSVQGYITAPHATWLHDYVNRRVGHDVECEYIVQPTQDLIVIPAAGRDVDKDLAKVDRSARADIQAELKKRGWRPPPAAREIGLYFELIEFRRLSGEFPLPKWKVYHRYPLINSQAPLLRRNNISCDIDIVGRKEKPLRCVEVKSVSGAPGSPFHISPREWQSRLWCRSRSVDYRVVVYYHARFECVERVEIRKSAVISHEPSGYWCFPES